MYVLKLKTELELVSLFFFFPLWESAIGFYYIQPVIISVH